MFGCICLLGIESYPDRRRKYVSRGYHMGTIDESFLVTHDRLDTHEVTLRKCPYPESLVLGGRLDGYPTDSR